MTGAVVVALRERLERVSRRPPDRPLREELAEIRHRVAAMPRLDDREPDEIVEYDEHGLPS